MKTILVIAVLVLTFVVVKFKFPEQTKKAIDKVLSFIPSKLKFWEKK